MRLGLSEVFKLVNNTPDRGDKVRVLRQNQSTSLWAILRYAFQPGIKWFNDYPPPDYRPCEYLDQETMLLQEIRKLYLFIDDGDQEFMGLTPIQVQQRTNLRAPHNIRRREKLFIELLERLSPADAKLLVCVKAGGIPGITAMLANEAFPGLIGGDVSDVEKVKPEDLQPIQVKIKQRGRPLTEDIKKKIAESQKVRWAKRKIKQAAEANG